MYICKMPVVFITCVSDRLRRTICDCGVCVKKIFPIRIVFVFRSPSVSVAVSAASPVVGVVGQSSVVFDGSFLVLPV